jgi:hypothetical protein
MGSKQKQMEEISLNVALLKEKIISQIYYKKLLNFAQLLK